MSRWGQLLRTLPLPKIASVWLVAFVLLGNIVLLLVEYRSAQLELERAGGVRIALEARQRAGALEYFLAERKGDLADLADARELSSYFENRALGMSMDYGLRASLLNIAERFRHALNRHRLRGRPVFSRIVLLDPSGRVLVGAKAPGEPEGAAVVPPAPEPGPGPAVRLTEDGRSLQVEMPYVFKEDVAGRLVAWLADEILHDVYLHRDDVSGAGYEALLVDARGRLYHPMGEHGFATRVPSPGSGPAVRRVQVPDGAGGATQMLLVETPLEELEFTLFTLMRPSEAFGAAPPRHILVMSITLSVLVLVGFLLLLRFRHANRLLRAKFAASARARGELEGRYSALEQEVRRRQEVEEELRLKQRQVEERTQELQKAVQEAHVLAFYDNLTGLANRLLFSDRLEQAIAGARRTGDKVGLLFLDLDRFKRINDTLGHQLGDQLLKETARRIEQAARGSDSVARALAPGGETYVSRQGGDEFTVLVSGLQESLDAAKVATRIIQKVGEPLTLDGYEMLITTSIGISVFPVDGHDAETLMKNADTAMYSTKERGGDAYTFYEAAMNAESLARLSLEAEMRKAIQRGEFELFYQPKVDTRTAVLSGVEALIRWRHPERGLVPPGEFIPLAEECGLIVPLGNWVLDTACADARRWQRQYGRTVPVSVNLSGRHFRQQNILESVDRALAASGFAPRWLEVELTESVLMQNTDQARYVLNRLRERGVRVALDDFGTGYSSLSYLKFFPIDTLKIDRSFVRDVPGDASDAALVRAIAAMAESLELRVVAEGVETPEQLAFLAEVGCHEVQGYLLSPPMPEPAFAHSLAEARAEPKRYRPLSGPDAVCA